MPRNLVHVKPVWPVGANKKQAAELLCQALETELGGVQVYEAAILSARNAGLRNEWKAYLDQTRNHVRVLRGVFEGLGLDPEADTPGRRVVREIGAGLVQAMATARQESSEATAQLVAAECVVLAQTKDHFNWELLAELAKALKAKEGLLLQAACDEVEGEEDEHLYHTVGWARELWLESLGLPAVLPPPEERKGVRSAIGAALAKRSRTTLLDKGR